MPDEAAETDAETTETAKPETGEPTDWKVEAEKWQALARKNEKQAKSNAEAATRLKELEPLAKRAKELEDAGKSESQRFADEAAQHKSRAEKAETELLRLRIAVRKGLSEVQAKRLVGSSEEELEADADELLESFRPAAPTKDKDDDEEPRSKPDVRRRPTERLRPGAVPSAEPDPTDGLNPRQLAALVSRDAF